jgi:hypothetical protein
MSEPAQLIDLHAGVKLARLGNCFASQYNKPEACDHFMSQPPYCSKVNVYGSSSSPPPSQASSHPLSDTRSMVWCCHRSIELYLLMITVITHLICLCILLIVKRKLLII